MIIKVNVITNAKKDSVHYDGERLVVRTTEQPVKGRANRQVVRIISGLFGFRADVVSGHFSRNKLIFVDGDDESISASLERLKQEHLEQQRDRKQQRERT